MNHARDITDLFALPAVRPMPAPAQIARLPLLPVALLLHVRETMKDEGGLWSDVMALWAVACGWRAATLAEYSLLWLTLGLVVPALVWLVGGMLLRGRGLRRYRAGRFSTAEGVYIVLWDCRRRAVCVRPATFYGVLDRTLLGQADSVPAAAMLAQSWLYSR